MTSIISNENKTIVVNTFFLYIRLLIVTLITLYTSRVILIELGVIDYGIYNLVGGIVFILGIMQSIMSSAISRYFMIEIGRNNIVKLNKYFSMSIIMLIPIALFVILLSESYGLWFLNNKLIIPPDRLNAANWVYQISIISFLVNLFSIPFISILVAREKMKIYAYLGILEVSMKLVIAYLLGVVQADKLVVYSFFSMLAILLVFIANYIYCKKNFIETAIKWFWDKLIFNEMFSYSIWSFFGAISSIVRNQGLNLLLGVFFSPSINAAKAVASQVNEGIIQFSSNFFTAVRPQITKRFAVNESENMLKLVFVSTRLSFYLILIIALPVMFEVNYILKLWLKTPPLNTGLFTRIIIFTALIDTLGYPLITAINATGKIKYYQIITGSTLILALPISYLFLKYGYSAETTLYVSMVISILAQCSRIVFMKSLHEFSVLKYLKEVIFIIFLVTACSSILPYIIITSCDSTFERFIVICITSIMSILIAIYFIGITDNEKIIIKKIISNKLYNDKK